VPESSLSPSLSSTANAGSKESNGFVVYPARACAREVVGNTVVHLKSIGVLKICWPVALAPRWLQRRARPCCGENAGRQARSYLIFHRRRPLRLQLLVLRCTCTGVTRPYLMLNCHGVNRGQLPLGAQIRGMMRARSLI
jgi:hypothetical protein